ncbi:MAG: hypothetical protein COZ80_04765 [Ignavibacteria bacterium CG_4_8_14_3_um_filter_37_9]|nr:hypothetical protein [Ignavibacteria bacterium]OIO20215.1 MAG: hypothetical protein AUJ54_05895 [Ignavibacteria bacterium CG1_02_37_35]PIP78113.1 MAG: hypothetical protein COW85_05440 [Ignavibacteria bacterium CG22_combo_CG10-13_8_21_14_all_37_15]PIS44257.1 MAG: hypothetical protein COT22_11510 [Ignavibacteria bacterium CG08_land_8_20_14_0_20_37_9]PIW99557.1 MAG: hypothetical protein COZ80_04765 [Ignavibacteria bacterium CG_4_8_14_3_um_filter_37_9]PIX92956.1 MAG: hypothetical protein COZ25_
MKKFVFLFLVAVSFLSQTINGQIKNQLTLSKFNFTDQNMNETGIHKEFLEATQPKKNIALAILYSALLPGMGELYADNYESGKYFTITDAALYGVYFGVNTYGDWGKENYKSFAKTYGGISLTSKNDDYFAIIGNYKNIDQYNDEKALEQRFTEMFDKNIMNWKWESETQRREYRGMWLSSQRAYNNLQFVVGAMLVNRLVSIINAVRSVVAYNKNLQEQTSWNIYFDANPNPLSTKNFSLNFISTF